MKTSANALTDRLLPMFLLLAIFLPWLPLRAETNREMAMSECIQMALQHNYDIQIERLSAKIAQYNLSGSYGAYEPSFHFNAEERFVDQPGEIDFKKSGRDFPYEMTTDSFGAGITGLLPSGLTYDAQANLIGQDARTDFNLQPSTANNFPPDGIRITNQFTSLAAISLKQPLLRGFWIDGHRERIWVNRKDLKISEMMLRWQIMHTVNAVQLAYFELIFAREKVRVQEHALELAKESLAGFRKRVKVGFLIPLDEHQAQAHLETIQTDLYEAQQTYSERQNVLKKLIVDDFQIWADVIVNPSEPLIAISEPLDRTESWRRAMSSRPDLVQSRLELEKLGIIARYRFNEILPSLDLVGAYGLQGGESSAGASLADIRSQTNPQYSYGVILNIPIGGNRAARNSYKASQAAKQQAALRLKNKEQDILVQVDDSLRLVQSSYKRTQSSHAARVYAEEVLKAEEKKILEGLSTPFFVLQFQDKLIVARTSEIRALADYNKALAQLALNEGSTLEKNHLNLEIR